jgi:hypothetical protein
MVMIEDVRSLALCLPRTTEALVHGRVKFDAWRMVVPKRWPPLRSSSDSNSSSRADPRVVGEEDSALQQVKDG